jgi:hypothetical protein
VHLYRPTVKAHPVRNLGRGRTWSPWPIGSQLAGGLGPLLTLRGPANWPRDLVSLLSESFSLRGSPRRAQPTGPETWSLAHTSRPPVGPSQLAPGLGRLFRWPWRRSLLPSPSAAGQLASDARRANAGQIARRFAAPLRAPGTAGAPDGEVYNQQI